MEIGEKNSGFGASYDENDIDDKEETEHVVCLMSPVQYSIITLFLTQMNKNVRRM